MQSCRTEQLSNHVYNSSNAADGTRVPGVQCTHGLNLKIMSSWVSLLDYNILNTLGQGKVQWKMILMPKMSKESGAIFDNMNAAAVFCSSFVLTSTSNSEI